MGNQFDSANRSYDEAQRKLDPLMGYLLDIRKALSTDLTRHGLAAAQPSVANANARAREVEAALTQSASELDTLGARTASFRVQDVK